MGESTLRRPAYRSLFWPIVLIGAGVIWLLANFNIVNAQNLAVLFRLWPLILIIIGLDILFGRQSPPISAAIGIGTVVLVVVLLVAGPSLGLVPKLEITTDSYTEPLEEVSSARVELNSSVGTVTVKALEDSSELVTADIAHTGEIDFATSGESEKVVSISQREQDSFNFGFNWPGLVLTENELYWNIGLNPDVPLYLDVNSGVGDGTYDLSQIELTGLNVNAGVGAVSIMLPAVEETINVDVNGSTGEIYVGIPEDAAIALDINGGVGNVTVDVPDGAAVRISATSGLGNVNLPGSYERVSGSDDNGIGEDGVWESEGFEGAGQQITIKFNGGVGNLNVR